MLARAVYKGMNITAERRLTIRQQPKPARRKRNEEAANTRSFQSALICVYIYIETYASTYICKEDTYATMHIYNSTQEHSTTNVTASCTIKTPSPVSCRPVGSQPVLRRHGGWPRFYRV